MQKVVINRCVGGFGLSREAYLELRKLKHPDAIAEVDVGEYWSDGSGPRLVDQDVYCINISRTDPLLLEVVHKLGKTANSRFSSLEVIEVPDGLEWFIEEYDGQESVVRKSSFFNPNPWSHKITGLLDC